MIEAVETTILTLLKDLSPLGTQHLDIQSEPVAWGATHASIDEDGIFHAPPDMTKKLPPVVLDGASNSSPHTSIGIFHCVRAISYKASPGFYSNHQSTQQMATRVSTSNLLFKRWEKKFEMKVKKCWHVLEEAVEGLLGPFPKEKRLKLEEFWDTCGHVGTKVNLLQVGSSIHWLIFHRISCICVCWLSDCWLISILASALAIFICSHHACLLSSCLSALFEQIT